MRLLNTWTGQFVEKDPRDPKTKYAILSHTWDEVEQTYQELRDIQKRYTPKRQPLNKPLVSPNDPPSIERRQSVSSGGPSSGCPVYVTKTTAVTATQHALSPPSLPSIQSSTPGPSSKTHAVSGLGPSPPDEPSDLSAIWDDPELSPKIRDACKVAREDGHWYLWIDSCCIDKTSSSELSEAINSMYQWYSRAAVCFAFLSDVPAEEDHEAMDSCFRRSRWFTRGWTLQELIAPGYVCFLSREWTFIGSKLTLVELVGEITNIDDTALLHLKHLDVFSVAQRFSWAAKRETTRVEDRAYSLLGIFDINMPTLYGEGNRAFRRLQEEILRRIPDQTLFAWTAHGMPEDLEPARRELNIRDFWWYLDLKSLLSPSLDHFNNCGRIRPISHKEVVSRLGLWRHIHLSAADYYSTPHGIRTQFPVIPFSFYFPESRRRTRPVHVCLIILQCEHTKYPGHLLARICCTPIPSSNPPAALPLYSLDSFFASWTRGDPFELLPLSPKLLMRLRWHLQPIDIKAFYIPHDERDDYDYHKQDLSLDMDSHGVSHETINLLLLKTARDSIYADGYTAKLRGPDHDHPATHWLTLTSNTHDVTITIEYRYTFKTTYDIQKFTMDAHWYAKMPQSLLKTDPENPREIIQGYSGTLTWSDCLPSRELSQGLQSVQLPADILGTEGWWMDANLTFISDNYYALHVKIRHEPSKRALIPAGLRSGTRACKKWAGKLATRAVSRFTHTRASMGPSLSVEFEHHNQGSTRAEDTGSGGECGGATGARDEETRGLPQGEREDDPSS